MLVFHVSFVFVDFLWSDVGSAYHQIGSRERGKEKEGKNDHCGELHAYRPFKPSKAVSSLQ